MKRYIMILVILGIVFVTACSLTLSETKPVPVGQVPTETISLSPFPLTETPIATDEDISDTQKPETTIESTITQQPFTATPTTTATLSLPPKPTATPHLLGKQVGAPAYTSNFAHPDLGCQWMGVAGQVFDGDGTPLLELVVEIGGSLSGQGISGLAITGRSESYGPGSYEIKLADQTVASSGTAWVQVYDLDGQPLSPPTYFATFEDCNKNLVMLNFVQTYTLPDNWVYLPLITH